MSLAIAVVGGRVPGWVAAIDPLSADLVEPGAVEDGLNRALARTDAPFFLPVQAEDRLEPAGVLALLGGLRRAPGEAVAAVAPAEQVRRDGGLRRAPATPADSRQALLALGRLATPVLFRTGALRAAGGWRPGEASWGRRAFRHRGLLARLLEQGGRLIAVAHPLGVVARPGEGDSSLYPILLSLLYKQVQVTARGPRERFVGRIAAVTPTLLTLAAPDGRIVLLPVERVAAVGAGAAEAVPRAAADPSPQPAAPPAEAQLRPDSAPAKSIPPGARTVARVWGRQQPPTWP